MKKLMMTMAMAAAVAVAYADGWDDLFRAQLVRMNTPSQESSENAITYLGNCDKETDAGEWSSAVRNMKRCIELEKNAGILRVDYNLADYYVWLAMLQWNIDETSDACSSMEEAIRLMKHGENLGRGCEKLAEKFLAKMRSGNLPSMFTSADIQSDCGIRKNITAPAAARFWQSTNASIARSNAISAWADSMSRTYQMQADSQARMARQSARQEYLGKTGREFSPDRDTRPSYGKARDEWDACKRVYDIFE